MSASATRAEVEQLVMADFEQLKGKLIRTTEVECSNGSDIYTMTLSSPITLRIATAMELERWMGKKFDGSEWCDPIYDVELVESTPEADAWLADGGYHVSWVYGPSRSTAGGYDKPRFKVLIGT